jgi:periplasmic divalent cation tolerance protein
MPETGFSVVLITAGSLEEARRLADILLKESLAACINILPGIESHYWWQGQLETASECLLLVKSRTSHVDAIIERVKQTHSYQVPEIIALPVTGGSEDYFKWLLSETREDR